MSCAKLFVEFGFLREREDAASCDDAVSVHDHAAVMQRCVRKEDAGKQFRGNACIKLGAGFLNGTCSNIPLHGDQCSYAMVCKKYDGFDDRINSASLVCRDDERRLFAEFGERAPDFRLEDHKQGNSKVDGESAKDPVQDCQIRKLSEGEK